jgi:hypothetical protein
MDRQKQIARTVYLIVVADVIALFLLLLVVQSHPTYLPLTAATYLVVALAFNFLFLRRKLKLAGPPDAAEQSSQGRIAKFWLYAASVIFFVGTIYGLILCLQGELPAELLPILLIPFSLAVYILRAALRGGVRKLA